MTGLATSKKDSNWKLLMVLTFCYAARDDDYIRNLQKNDDGTDPDLKI